MPSVSVYALWLGHIFSLSSHLQAKGSFIGIKRICEFKLDSRRVFNKKRRKKEIENIL